MLKSLMKLWPNVPVVLRHGLNVTTATATATPPTTIKTIRAFSSSQDDLVGDINQLFSNFNKLGVRTH